MEYQGFAVRRPSLPKVPAAAVHKCHASRPLFSVSVHVFGAVAVPAGLRRLCRPCLRMRALLDPRPLLPSRGRGNWRIPPRSAWRVGSGPAATHPRSPRPVAGCTCTIRARRDLSIGASHDAVSSRRPRARATTNRWLASRRSDSAILVAGSLAPGNGRSNRSTFVRSSHGTDGKRAHLRLFLET